MPATSPVVSPGTELFVLLRYLVSVVKSVTSSPLWRLRLRGEERLLRGFSLCSAMQNVVALPGSTLGDGGIPPQACSQPPLHSLGSYRCLDTPKAEASSPLPPLATGIAHRDIMSYLPARL